MTKKRNIIKKRKRSKVDSESANIVRAKTSKTDGVKEVIELSDDMDVIVIDADETADQQRQQRPTTSSEAQMEKIDAILNSKKFIILKGPCGCGKTNMAREIARRRDLPINVIPINDNYDSKVIFGSYTCTEVPGKFIWQSSKFAQCMQQRSLILLKNLDRGGADLAATLINLAERGFCILTNSQRLQMHADCRIIGAITLDEKQQRIHPILRDYPYALSISTMSVDDLCSILTAITRDHTGLADVNCKLIHIFDAVCSLIRDHKSVLDRLLNAKDLFRAAHRLFRLRDSDRDGFSSDRGRIFAELLDTWVMHLSNAQLRQQVAMTIGEALSISPEEQHYQMNVRLPDIKISKEDGVVRIGRATLMRREKAQVTGILHNSFVLTRDSAQLLERIAICIVQLPLEPVLLTGDTGVGKTAIIQHLAQLVHIPLRVVNLSQDSEFSDLIGGYKPTTPMMILQPLADDYIKLFLSTLDAKKNAKFLDNLDNCFKAERFADFIALIVRTSSRALQQFPHFDKRYKQWTEMLRRASRLSKSFGHNNNGEWRQRLLFSHVKGVLTEAAEQGHWILVDEINLAPAECLDALVEILESTSSVHPDFRLFGCMNNANDVGKRSLPLGLRSHFTELFVCETRDAEQLRQIISGQIQSINRELLEAILNFYLDICALFPGKFNLRTLNRALLVANDQRFSCHRSCLHRGCSIAFVSQLNEEQQKRMRSLIEKYFGSAPSPSQLKLKKDDIAKFVLFDGFLIPRGNEFINKDISDSYIITPSVKSNLVLLASIVATRRFPILLEGETSAGKTSIISHLANMTGNRVYRINNHEHSDIQEYIGSYAPDIQGRLTFMEGVLLRAMRNGDWIILDELNLAPSPVLEALNRLLDDNRELFVPEINCLIRAHPNFQLFATQNPVGLYAGRKRLSRAFLSRFMVLHWNSLPHSELPQIVSRRCGVSPKMAELMTSVQEELKARRSYNGIFASADGLMTLRDLFRWAIRMASSSEEQAVDWRQTLADQGYLLLGSRCRTKQDELTVLEVLERHLERKIDPQRLFGPKSAYLPSQFIDLPTGIMLSSQLRRMLILCAEAWRCNEPVLLVGETGCGKTTAVHLFGDCLSINCHERTDAADLLGSIRPFADGGFRWQDGVVLQAMRQGKRLLLDEISLASDSVLERLNSLLEPQRTILLTDSTASASADCDEQEKLHELVTAAKDFQLVATMNPGNDHGKKELSKALRNRFTEIWCPQEHNHDDLIAIAYHRLRQQIGQNNELILDKVAQFLVEFTEFFTLRFNDILRFSLSIRDLVSMAELFAHFYTSGISFIDALYHSIEANLLDALGVLPSRVPYNRKDVIELCVKQFRKLTNEIGLLTQSDEEHLSKDGYNQNQQLRFEENALTIGPFRIEYDDSSATVCFPSEFSLNAPTTRRNTLRVARALASKKPVMLEGSPGAGKSSLIVALAEATGHKLFRLNLSEQTDLYDLFGGDMPVPSDDTGANPSFAWQDGPVLRAIKEGAWILLDEMNLASQSVLEGLNSCFDFRKNIYISELDRTFEVDPSRCKFFACQNPYQQGGDRRALPKSLLNRFTSIFIEDMTDDDFIYILCEFCKSREQTDSKFLFTDDCISKMVLVNKLCRELLVHERWGLPYGGPFEFNLRDLFRWVEAVEKFGGNFAFGFDLIYLSRLSKREAKEKVISEVYNPVFADQPWVPSLPLLHWTCDKNKAISIGNVPLQFNHNTARHSCSSSNSPFLLSTQMDLLERIAACARANWLVLLTGPPSVGKKSAIRALASMVEQPLEYMRLTSETDALDLLGSFEQIQKGERSSNFEKIELMNEQLEDDDAYNLQFEWMDSTFVQAYREGHWLLVEDVNCCSSAVLDCLNSCLESSNGKLVLPIQQQNGINSATISRHKDFRIFFTINSLNGQISRSMRNRAVEIAFCTDPNEKHCSFWNFNLCDTLTVVFGSSNTKTYAFPNKQLSLVSQQTREIVSKLNRTLLDCPPRAVLCCAAQLDFNKNLLMDEQIFCKLIENFTQLLLQENNIGIAFNQALSTNILGLDEFPRLVRMRASNPANDELVLYYYRCWNEVSTVYEHPIVCLQLALLFPVSIRGKSHQWLEIIENGLFNVINDKSRKIDAFKMMLSLMDRLKSDCRPLNFDQELFGSVFQAELLQWKDQRTLVSNETLEGQCYMTAIRVHGSQCHPFLTSNQMEQYRKRWSNLTITVNDDDEEAITTFGTLQQHFNKILWAFNRIFDDDLENNLLPWKDNDNARFFEFGWIGSTNFSSSEEEIHLFFSHLQIAFVASDVNRNLWSRLHYDDSDILCHLRMGELANVESELDKAFLTLWELAFVRKTLVEDVSEFFKHCIDKYANGTFHSTYQSFTPNELAKTVMQLTHTIRSLIPPKNFIDPPYFVHLQRMYWQQRLNCLEAYLMALQLFLQLTIGKHYELDQISALSSSTASMFTSVPILPDICSAYRQAVDELNKLNSDTDDHYSGSIRLGTNEQNKYRCCWEEGQESQYEKHFQHELLERLMNASGLLYEAICGSDLEFAVESCVSSTNEDRTHLQSKLNNLLHTILTIKRRLTSNEKSDENIPPLILIYPELLSPFLSLLSLLAITLAELKRKIGQQLIMDDLYKTHRFSQSEFYALKQMLSPSSADYTDEYKQTHAAQQALLPWAISEISPLTARQKLALCVSNISRQRSEQNSLCIQWIFQQWEQWHEQNARIHADKQQLIVVKKAKKKTIKKHDIEEEEYGSDEELRDTDELQLRAYLPDFSKTIFDSSNGDEDTSEQSQQPSFSSDMLYNAIYQLYNSLISHGEVSTTTTTQPDINVPFLSLMQIVDKLQLYSVGLNDEYLAYNHLFALEKLRETLRGRVGSVTSTTSVLNVYRDSDPASLSHCLQCLLPLQHRTQQILKEFPENSQLISLNGTIDLFSQKMPANAPLMKHAAQLGHILVRAEEWEFIADRAHSIREQMIPLQDLLVDWRRREVQCWAGLISIIRSDCKQLAVLAGWPLFKCALDELKSGKQNINNSLLLMFLDWMHNSSLGDFDARLWTGKLLVNCLRLLEKGDDDGALSHRVHNLCAHFEQFVPSIMELYALRFHPIECELRDFCRVVRYTDLNVWSVQESAKRAHAQLFRILRKFKELCNEPVSNFLLDKLPRMPEWNLAEFAPILTSSVGDFEISRSFDAFLFRMDTSLSHLLDMDALEVLKNQAIDLFNAIQTDIKYYEVPKCGNKDSGEVHSANEKLQGRALFKHQQHFAHLVKAASQLGLVARRAHNIESEALTIQTMADLAHSLDELPQNIGTHFRHSVAARNVFLRHFAVFRRQQHPQLAQQLPPSTLEHMRGITEFSLHWIYNALSLLKRITIDQRTAQIIANYFMMEFHNAKRNLAGGEDVGHPHAQLSAKFLHNDILINTSNEIANKMRRFLQIVPKEDNRATSTVLPPSLCRFLKPLGALRQPSTEYNELDKQLRELEDKLKQMKSIHDKMASSSAPFLEMHKNKNGNGDVALCIWDRTVWSSYTQSIDKLRNIGESMLASKLPIYFEEECAQLNKIIDKLTNNVEQEPAIASSLPAPASLDELELAVQLHLQSIYKKIELCNKNREDEKTPILDNVKHLLEFASKLETEKIFAQLCEWFSAKSSLFVLPNSSSLLKDITQGFVLARGIDSALTQLIHNICVFVSLLSSFHAQWTAISCHLLAKGFVNPIPEIEQKIDTNKQAEAGSGFGDADLAPNATDVSNQVENMEQIEGLKENAADQLSGEEKDGTEQQQRSKDYSDVEHPIDIEDDFACSLEGLDANEEEEKGQEEIDENDTTQNDEDRTDWNFGEVEEPEETQLDPKLWEPEQEQQQKEGDENGAHQLTDDLTARQQSNEDPTNKDNTLVEKQPLTQEHDEHETGQDSPAGSFEEENQQSIIENQPMMQELSSPSREGDVETDKDNLDEEAQDGLKENAEDKNVESSIENEGIDEGEELQKSVEEDEKSSGQEDKNCAQMDDEDDLQKQKPTEKKLDEQRVEGNRGDGDDWATETDEDRHEDQRSNRTNDKSVPKSNGQTNEKDDDDGLETENGGDGGESVMPSSSGRRTNADDLPEDGKEAEEKEDEPISDEIEPGDSSDNKLSAHASATLEQARRTRSLFHSHLRRLHRKQQQHAQRMELATESITEENPKEQTEQGMELVEEGIEAGNGEEGGIQDSDCYQNIFIGNTSASDEMQAKHDLTVKDPTTDTIDRLCAEFDRMEQFEQQNGSQQLFDDKRKLQLKWSLITDAITPLAAELTESLRVILEPSIASRLQGDYRTGKRLNMRRLIPYIASDYRKDRIWMRRTKKSRRNYQICIAVDNSQSMQHNHMTELTCNALCLIDRALRQLEVGQVALCSFGSQVELICDFDAPTEDPAVLGVQILRNLRFDQSRTDLAQLLITARSLFNRAREHGGIGNETPEQMLIILGDGRGVFTEGVERIRQALAHLSVDHVTVLFLIMDIPAISGDGAKSIMELRFADFSGGQCTFHPYMQRFPFPLYALVRDTNALPSTVAEAVRQWFEYTMR